jgi:hypothetical protein
VQPSNRRALAAAFYKRVRRLRPLRTPSRALFARDLRRLNDVLSATELAGRYWVFGGLLLGWAREGSVLGYDSADADFAIRREDFDRLCASVPALERAGFRRLFRFANNAGEVTELTFMRRGAQFEFFSLTPTGGTFRYFMYGFDKTGAVEVEVEEPLQALAPFEFVGRTWLKPADHDLELSATYGNWRAPNPDWWYLDQPNVVERRQWQNSDYIWHRR